MPATRILIDPKRNRRRKFMDKAFKVVAVASTLAAIAILAILLGKLVNDGWRYLNLELITNFPGRRPEGSGVRSAIMGSIWVVSLTALFTIPIGIGAAIWLEEFNDRKNWFTELIRLNIQNLSAIPSIIYGLLGLVVFVTWLNFERSILAGALTMSLLILPMLILVSQEALKAVPQAYREASIGLGATRWQTITRVVLPSALSGILTGIILSLSRVIGETAPLIVVGAVTFAGFSPRNVWDNYTVLPLQIFDWIQRPQPGFHDKAAGAILLLMIALLALNSIAIILRIRSQKSH
ncbi:MAG: phosphate ABC transporter permease PstA [Fimbriimonadaceae bacterium]